MSKYWKYSMFQKIKRRTEAFEIKCLNWDILPIVSSWRRLLRWIFAHTAHVNSSEMLAVCCLRLVNITAFRCYVLGQFDANSQAKLSDVFDAESAECCVTRFTDFAIIEAKTSEELCHVFSQHQTLTDLYNIHIKPLTRHQWQNSLSEILPLVLPLILVDFYASTSCYVFYTSPCPDECLVVWPEAAYQRGWQVHYHALPPTWTRVQGCWRVHYTCAAANLDSSAGLASPLHTWCGQLGLICRSGESLTHVMWPTWTHPQGHTYCSRGIIWPHAVLSCLVEYVFL